MCFVRYGFVGFVVLFGALKVLTFVVFGYLYLVGLIFVCVFYLCVLIVWLTGGFVGVFGCCFCGFLAIGFLVLICCF